jgi:hypothetical protein
MYGDLYPLNKKELAPFVELPDGSIPDFHMPKLRCKHHYDSGIDYWEAPFYDKTSATLTYFSKRIVDSLSDGDIISAAKFAGTMAHFFEDNAVPAHAVDDTDVEIVKDFLPPPPEMRCFAFHSEMERSPAPFDLNGYEPEPMGGSVDETAFLFIDRVVETTLFARSRILEFFKAFYVGDDAKIAELNLEICMYAAKVYADYIHSLNCLAFDRVSESSNTASKSLTELYPFRQTAWAGGGYSQTAPGDLVGVSLDASFHPVPATLKFADGEVSNLPDSLCGTAYYEYEFRIPKGVYRSFSFDYGLNAGMISRTPLVFEVFAGESILFQDEIAPDDFAKSAVVALENKCDSIRLITRLDESVDVQKVNGRPIVETGHAVWGNPRLRQIPESGC